MQTDIPLKSLTTLRGADLLPLLGLPYDTLLKVETRELPATAKRLDNVLTIRSPAGQKYIHVIEWQGYHDPVVLWRMVGYLAWLGQQMPGTAIVGTVVYLAPSYDVGETLSQRIDDQVVQEWNVHCIRLWEHDAAAAVSSGNIGLTILSPLMQNASSSLVEQAIDMVLKQTPEPQHGDLLSILGVFAEPLIHKERFIRLIGREQLMKSGLLEYLIEEREAELQQEYEAKLQAQVEEREAQLKAEYETRLQQEREAQLQAQVEAELRIQREELCKALEDVIIARFPQAPIALIQDIRQITWPAQLRSLIVAAARATTLEQFASELKQAANGHHPPPTA